MGVGEFGALRRKDDVGGQGQLQGAGVAVTMDRRDHGKGQGRQALDHFGLEVRLRQPFADGDVAQVFVVDGAVARKREVKGAFIDGNNVALSSGLSSGTPLVTEGALYLVDGERISPITTAAN